MELRERNSTNPKQYPCCILCLTWIPPCLMGPNFRNSSSS
uniref:Ras-GTPase-activating protein-binding protein n=1 Tax=Rhizophora mucronata TaxID=61149 RepID=A0A2P2IZV3_RHIMU